MNIGQVSAFIIYFLVVLAIGVYFFVKDRDGDDKQYFLGGRSMGPWVTALSAQASDMSGWLLMGFPGSLLAFGMGKVWIGIGLGLGTAANWIFVATRLRRFSKAANDSITLPQYLTNRFVTTDPTLKIVCAIIFLISFTIYVASAFVSGQTVLCALFPWFADGHQKLALAVFALIILAYTFMGGFLAVCWTDFFQGLLMLAALLIAPIFALGIINNSTAQTVTELPENYWHFARDWREIASGLGWGLGYFGMPHIIIRFMSVRSQKELRKSSVIGISWTLVILTMSVAAGAVGRVMSSRGIIEITDSATVFIQMTRAIFPALISGILLSAILAASMSTADSQLLASASAFASDVYKPVFRKDASDREMLWAGRVVVIIIAVIALIVASNPNSGTIMGLVENAWGVFGAAFGPTILLSLFWRRLTFGGAVAGIVCGALADILWLALLKGTGLYEIIPGFIVGLIAAVVVSLITPTPDAQVEALFDRATSPQED